jgi:GT2 family glycosyltransferase
MGSGPDPLNQNPRKGPYGTRPPLQIDLPAPVMHHQDTTVRASAASPSSMVAIGWYGASSMWRTQGEITMSVVVCTLNRCANLRQALEGLARQTFRRFEVIVVNGPSSDGTAELLSGYPVRVGTCSEAHIPRSRNVGIRMAAGDVFAFLDDDAVPEPDWLEQLASAYEDPTVAAAGGPVFDVPLGHVEWAMCTCTREGAVNVHSEPPAERYLGRGADPFLYLPACNMSVRRSALRRAGGFNPELPYCYEDVEVCMRLVDAGARIAWVETALVRHERAASWLRDGEQTITDPYAFMFSAAAFVEQSAPASAPKVLAEWAATWKSEWTERVPDERRAWFRERIDEGIVDGVRVGRRPRETMRLDRQERDDFKPYASTG